MSSGGWSKTRLGRMHEIMAGHVERGALPGLVTLVARRGEVHVDAIGTQALGGDTPMRRDTIFRIASITKPIAAVAAMILVEECRLRLDDPVDRLLPELADRKVLRSLGSPLTDTVPAKRSITVRDLLTFRLGLGAVMAMPGTYPIQEAMEELGLSPGPNPVELAPDEWMRRLGTLPLAHQPGEAWMYHTGSDVLGVLVARASAQPFEVFLQERVFAPLGMKDTAFHVPGDKLDRLPPSYASDRRGAVVVHDEPRGRWCKPPGFPSAGGGLVSTVDDYAAFLGMMLGLGKLGSVRILSRPSIELMVADHLTPKEKTDNAIFFADGRGWGFGISVVTERRQLAFSPGSFGWEGGTGTSAYVDPEEDLIGILMTQRLMTSPEPPAIYRDFWNATYQAIDD